MARVHHRVGIAANPDDVFDCLIHPDKLIGWWASTAESEQTANGFIRLGFAEFTTFNFEIQEFKPPEFLKLRCAGEPEIWKGSSLEFRTEPSDNQTY